MLFLVVAETFTNAEQVLLHTDSVHVWCQEIFEGHTNDTLKLIVMMAYDIYPHTFVQ